MGVRQGLPQIGHPGTGGAEGLRAFSASSRHLEEDAKDKGPPQMCGVSPRHAQPPQQPRGTQRLTYLFTCCSLPATLMEERFCWQIWQKNSPLSSRLLLWGVACSCPSSCCRAQATAVSLFVAGSPLPVERPGVPEDRSPLAYDQSDPECGHGAGLEWGATTGSQKHLDLLPSCSVQG